MNVRALAARGRHVIEALTSADLAACDAHSTTNPLYVSRDVTANGLVWSWQRSPRSQVREWITLASDDERMQLAIHGDSTNLDVPLLDWRAHAGETQLLAWTVAHEPLIDLIRTVLQRELTPIAIDDCDACAPGDCVPAGFSVRKTDGTPVAAGSMRLPPQAIDRCVSRVDAAQTVTQPWLTHVPAHLSIIVDEFFAGAADLTRLAPGCIVRLDNRTLRSARARVAISAGRMRLVAELQDLRARIAGAIASTPDLQHFPQGASMTEQNATQTMPKNSGIGVDSVPVRLTFSAGRLTVPFGALADIKPGYVFELDRRLNDQTIVIQANDVSIATGELVVLGDFLGVRITRLLPKA